MSRIGVAFRALFAALGSAETAQRLEAVLSGRALPKSDAEAKSPPPAAATPESRPARSEAITLLAALQREARLVDLVKQPLASFSDEEIGAAARNVLGDCSVVLDRFFALQTVATQEEGTVCDVPKGYDSARFKVSGSAEGTGPFRGKLTHHGWQASTVKLPSWTGSKEAALIIAPAEVEV